MKRFYLPKSARLWCVFIGTLALCTAGQLEATYRGRMAKLPALVDQHGYIASVEVAISGLDSYTEAKKYHTFSITSLFFGVLSFGFYAVSTSQKSNLDSN